jgi:uncharacterized protein with HEPN domain
VSREPWVERVAVAIEDIDRITEFISGMDREAFCRDERTVFAVCYAFVRIGEAMRHIPSEVQAAHPRVEWKAARDFRNFTVHVYLAVDPRRLYNTAVKSLPPLRAALSEVIAGLK